MQRPDYVLRDEPIEPRHATWKLIEPQVAELLPFLRHRFSGCILDSIVSVKLTYSGTLCILRKDGLPEDFLRWLKNSEEGGIRRGEPLREVELGLMTLLPESAAAELISACKEVPSAQDDFALSHALDIITEFIDSMPLVEAMDVLKPELMGLVCEAGEARRENEFLSQKLEEADGSLQLLKGWCGDAASAVSVYLYDELAKKVFERLDALPASGIFGEGFKSIWEEHCYAVSEGTLLDEIAEGEIDRRIQSILSEQSQHTRLLLWLGCETGVEWIDDRIRYRDAIDDYQSRMDMSLVRENIRHALRSYFVEVSLDN